MDWSDDSIKFACIRDKTFCRACFELWYFGCGIVNQSQRIHSEKANCNIPSYIRSCNGWKYFYHTISKELKADKLILARIKISCYSKNGRHCFGRFCFCFVRFNRWRDCVADFIKNVDHSSDSLIRTLNICHIPKRDCRFDAALWLIVREAESSKLIKSKQLKCASLFLCIHSNNFGRFYLIKRQHRNSLQTRKNTAKYIYLQSISERMCVCVHLDAVNSTN